MALYKIENLLQDDLYCYYNQPTKVTPSHKVWFDDVSTVTSDIGTSGSKRSLEAATKEGTTYTYICLIICV